MIKLKNVKLLCKLIRNEKYLFKDHNDFREKFNQIKRETQKKLNHLKNIKEENNEENKKINEECFLKSKKIK